jgi:hypothetical protein
MQPRQLRPGDILDDYCPRERRLTNHVVVAMIGEDVKQTRCTTCDADHEYKHARVPRQRKKPEALPPSAAAPMPRRVTPESPEIAPVAAAGANREESGARLEAAVSPRSQPIDVEAPEHDDQTAERTPDEGPVHRQLIRAQLPRIEGQPPVPRQAPDFTIRQPGGRTNRFRPRHQRGGGQSFQGNRSNGNIDTRGGPPRHGGRPPLMSHLAKRHGGGPRKRSK